MDGLVAGSCLVSRVSYNDAMASLSLFLMLPIYHSSLYTDIPSAYYCARTRPQRHPCAALHGDGDRVDQVSTDLVRVSPCAVLLCCVVHRSDELLCRLAQPARRLHCERQVHSAHRARRRRSRRHLAQCRLLRQHARASACGGQVGSASVTTTVTSHSKGCCPDTQAGRVWSAPLLQCWSVEAHQPYSETAL